jgi:uncharacterized protein (UPF0261 family)
VASATHRLMELPFHINDAAFAAAIAQAVREV